jgi:ABC-type sugar transport system permease subunit
MFKDNIYLALAGIIITFLALFLILALSLVMLKRSRQMAEEKGPLLKLATFILAVLYGAALAAFLIRPGIALYIAGVAVIGSMATGFFLRKGFDRTLNEEELAIFFLLPAFLGVLALYYYPITQTLVYSFHAMRYTSNWMETPFIWFQNYGAAFASANFRRAFGFTAYFTFGTVTLCFFIGLGMALASYWIQGRLRGFVRAVIVIPWAIPLIITASIWRWTLNSDVGPFAVLRQWGIVDSVPVFLSDPILAIHSVILADAWKWSPLVAIFLIGALATIPQEMFDAAKVDGAGAFRRFSMITLPMIAPTIFVALMFRSMEALRVFDIVYGMTGGGPGSATETLSTFAYKFYFSYSRFGMGSAYAMVVFIIIFFLSFVYVKKIYKNLRFR